VTTDTDWAVVINGWSVFVAPSEVLALSVVVTASPPASASAPTEGYSASTSLGATKTDQPLIHRLFGLRGEGKCDREGVQQPRAFARNSHVHKIIPTEGYSASTSLGATKTDQPLITTAQSVSVVTRQEMASNRVAPPPKLE
jgi:outer membrane receptor protein involved in Fe transport